MESGRAADPERAGQGGRRPGKSYIFFYVVPAKIAGRWESRISTGGHSAVYDFDFDQSFQMVSGDAYIDGKKTRLPLFRVRGDQIGFELETPEGRTLVRHRFQGRIRQDTIEGTVTTGTGAAQKQVPWSARLKVRGEMRMSGLD